MRLRKTITIPTRFEEEDPLPAKSRNGTRPTYPALLKEQVIPFNPNHQPAAFPSLSLKAKDASDHVDIETESEHSFHDSCSGREGLPTDILGDINAPEVLSDQHEPDLYPNTNLPLDQVYNLARDDEFEEHDDPTLVDMMPPPLHDPNDTSISEQDQVHSVDYYSSTWSALPLSLQSHIYIVLSQKYSPKSVSKVLGLTESEFDGIQKAIRLRSLHPASLSEIWEYANQLSNSIPGLPASTSIDVNTLNEYMDYMIFASNYACAFEFEVRNARNFLASRGIASDLLGTWLPDPSEPEGSQCLVHVPGILGRASLPAIDVHDDSGYSSMSEGDRDVSHTQGYSSLSTGTSRLELNADKYAHERGFAQAERPDFINAHNHLSGGLRKLGQSGTLLTTKPARHPLSIVTKPDESPVQGRNGVEAMEMDSTIDFDASVAREYAFDPESTLVLGQEDMTDVDQSVVRDTEVQCNSSCKETSTEDIPKQCGTRTERSSNTPLVAVEEASEDIIMPGRPNPHHLVLRIQNKDGLARIMRKGAKSTDSHPARAKEPELPAYPNGYEKHHSAEVAPLRPMNVNTKMSSFSKALIESALHASKEITTNSKSNYLPFLAFGTPTKPGSLPTFLNKRKASQTDIHPTSPKTQRTLTHSQLSSPRNGIVTEEDNNIILRHSQAKQSWTPRASSSRTSSEISTPTKCNAEITEFVASQSAGAHSSSRSPRSPSYSPISENEELEEFQALIRGPKAPNLSIKIPTPNMELAPLKTLSSTPTPGLSLQFQQGVTLKSPALRGSGPHAVKHPSTKVSSHAAESVAEADTPSSPNEVGDLVAAPMPKIKLVVRCPSSTLDTAADDANSKVAKSGSSSILQSQAREHEIEDDLTAVSTPSPNQEEEPKSKPAKRARPKKEILQPEAKAQAKAPPKKRGPRGPYRKTKERLAREEQERTMQNEQDQNQAEQAAHAQQQEAQPEQAPQQEPITCKKKAPMF